MDIYEVRRKNLLELIDSKFEGNRSSFSRFVSKNVNMINLCLTNNLELRRNIGEKLARELEGLCSMPPGWLDEDRTSSSISRMTTSIPRLTTMRAAGEMVTEMLTVGDAWLRSHHPGRQSYASISVHILNDDTMQPTLARGDAILVDTEETDTGNGVFVLESNNEVFVRRLMRQFGGDVTMSADNSKYPPLVLDSKKSKGVKLLGKVIGRLHYETL